MTDDKNPLDRLFVEDDRVLAAASEVLHRKRTGHHVEYNEIGPPQ